MKALLPRFDSEARRSSEKLASLQNHQQTIFEQKVFFSVDLTHMITVVSLNVCGLQVWTSKNSTIKTAA